MEWETSTVHSGWFSLPTCSYLGTVIWDSRPLLFLPYAIIFSLLYMSLCIYCGVVREFQWMHGNLYMYLNLHLFPSYAWNNKHCYGGDDTNGCWQTDGHINGHNTGMREQFPAPTHREAEWSVLHIGTGEALLTLECAAVFMLNLSCCWWGLDGSLILSTTISSCKYQYHNCDCVFWVQ